MLYDQEMALIISNEFFFSATKITHSLKPKINLWIRITNNYLSAGVSLLIDHHIYPYQNFILYEYSPFSPYKNNRQNYYYYIKNYSHIYYIFK